MGVQDSLIQLRKVIAVFASTIIYHFITQNAHSRCMSWRLNRMRSEEAHKHYTPKSLVGLSSVVNVVLVMSLSHGLKKFSFSVTVLRRSKDLKKEMSLLVKSFLFSFKKNVEALSERHRQERRHLMQVERERDQEAADAVSKYYRVLSLRDIRQEWSHRRKPLKSKMSSMSCRKSCNPTQWPFTEATNQALTNTTLPWKPNCHPLGKKYAVDHLSTPFTLEPNIRVVEETRL